MEKHKYDELTDRISEKLAEEFFEKEMDLPERAATIDEDISEILQEAGRKATKKVLEKTRDKIVGKKKSEGLTVHRNPTIEYNVKFGKIEIKSSYLWKKGSCSKPPIDEMGIRHEGRSRTVDRALTDFGIEESFGLAAKRFKEHYNFEIGSSAVARATGESANLAEEYLEKRFAEARELDRRDIASVVESMLVEIDGCEIRTALLEEIEGSDEKTPAYGNPKKRKVVNWRDVRLGFARPLESDEKTFVGRMDSYPVVVGQLRAAALMKGMGPSTDVVAVADGGNGIMEELKRQFPEIQFVSDKAHLKGHFYDTAEKLGIPEKKRAAWVAPRVESVCEGRVESVLEELEKIHAETGNERLKRLIGYVERFRDAVHYDSFKEKGYPIGSGEIESAHKYIPQKRLKIAGASWHPDSINPMLALRILRADDYWDDFWEERKSYRRAA